MVTNDLLSCVLPVEEFPEINSRAVSSAHCEDAAHSLAQRERGSDMSDNTPKQSRSVS
jgi:hypothetical protein